MLKKNRILTLVVALVLCMGLLSGCGMNGATGSGSTGTKGKKSVVCTIFPEYDWAKEVVGDLGDHYELTLLLDNGVDLHSYQPTAMDIAKIASCDVFIYVGGESDGWVEDALKESTNPNMQVINLLEVLGDSVKEEEIVEGMEAEEEEHDHGEDNGQTESTDVKENEKETDAHDQEVEEVEYDEHVWLSLKNAKVLTGAITDAFKTIDADHADQLQANCDSYVKKLTDLDEQYKSAVAAGSKNTILFGDRFPFRYMVDDYKLNYYAAFVGCSAETEASFTTVVFLAGKVDELGLSNVMVIENSDQKIAQTVINNTANKNQSIQVLNSMQSTTSKDIKAGTTYLSIMESNLEVLKNALK